MTSPEEEQRKKSAEVRAKEPDKSAASNDPFSFVGQLIGDAKNLAVDAVAGEHSGDKVLSGITPQLAAQYQHGKDVQARIDSGAVKQDQLSEADRRNLDAYNNVRKSVTQVPLYDRDSLLRYVEKGIEQKAKTAPPQSNSSSPAARSTQPEAGRPVAQLTTAPKEVNKPVPKEASRPAAQESNKPTSAKDVSAKPPAARPQDQPVSKVFPDQLDAKKTSPQSIQQNKDLPGAATSQTQSDAKTGSVKPASSTQSPERNVGQAPERNVLHSQDKGIVQSGDGKTVSSKAQSESSQGYIFKDRGDSTRSTSTSGNKDFSHDVDKQSHPTVSSSGKIPEQSMSQRSASADRDQPVQGDEPTNKHQPSQTSASSVFERRTGSNTKSDDMRSVLEERVSFANNQSKLRASEQQPGKTASNAESVTTRPSLHLEQSSAKTAGRAEQFSGNISNRTEILQSNPGSADRSDKLADSQVMQRKVSLTDVKNALSAERLQQIARDSAERFPSGLRWQNTITRQEATPGARAVRQTEISTSSVSAANRSADVALKNPSASSHDGVENTSSISKSHQPGVMQPGIFLSGIIQQGEVSSGSAHAGTAQPGNIDFGTVRSGDSHAGSRQTGTNSAGPKPEPAPGRVERQPASALQPNFPSANPEIIRDHKGGIVNEGQPGAMHNWQGLIAADARTLSFRGRIENRYITGAEIALAAIIAAAGAKRVRFDELQPPGKETTIQIPMVQSIEAYLPNRTNLLSDNAGAAPDLKDGRVIQQTSDTEEVTDRPTGDRATGGLKTGDRAPSDRKPADRKGDDESAVDDLSADDVPGTLRYLQTHRYARRTMLIGPGDTLVGIAEAKCDDSIYGWLVADLNITKTKETYVDGKRIVEVRSRETIDLPTREDMDAFDRHRREEFKPENLITIVVETQIDRELLDEHLGIFVEGGSKVSGTLAGSSPGGPPISSNPAAASVFNCTTPGADGSLALPFLSLESGNVLRIASHRLLKMTQRALESGRKPLSNFRELLKREKIKRRF